MDDLISRQAAIKAIKEDKIDLTDPNVVAVFKATGDFEKAETQSMICDRHIKILKDLPSAQQEITYQVCSDALLMMWMDKVLTDGEYNRIMDKLNAWKEEDDE